MASTDLGRRLTEGHKVAQARLSASTIRQMASLWRILDFDGTRILNIDEWVTAVGILLTGQHAVSAEMARAYYGAFRAAETGEVALARLGIPTLPLAQIKASMMATGPAKFRSGLARGFTVDEAGRNAALHSAKAGARLALQGGRQMVLFNVLEDDRALGWARAAGRSKPCAFCAMLIGRGPVYKSEGSADFDAHDSCWCEPEPVFDRNQPWPPGAASLHQLWSETARGQRDPLNAFRRAYEGADENT